MNSSSNSKKTSGKIWQRSLQILQKLYWDVPSIVVTSVHQIAKFHRCKLPYDTMKTIFECHLFNFDTDSLLYKIRIEDL